MGGRIDRRGFTLLEVLVSVAILGIAVTLILQLFSSNLRAVAASEDYVAATLRAESKLRDFLDRVNVSEGTVEETTPEGYRVTVTVSDVLREKTDGLPVKLLEVHLAMAWTRGAKEKTIRLKTMKVVGKSRFEKAGRAGA